MNRWVEGKPSGVRNMKFLLFEHLHDFYFVPFPAFTMMASHNEFRYGGGGGERRRKRRRLPREVEEDVRLGPVHSHDTWT